MVHTMDMDIMEEIQGGLFQNAHLIADRLD
jgi:hypothetical protein